MGSKHCLAVLRFQNFDRLQAPSAARCAAGLAICYWRLQSHWHFFHSLPVEDILTIYLLELASPGGPAWSKLFIVTAGKVICTPASVVGQSCSCLIMHSWYVRSTPITPLRMSLLTRIRWMQLAPVELSSKVCLQIVEASCWVSE